MPLLEPIYNDPDNPTLTEYLALLRQVVNNLDNDNVRPSAGIESSKIQNGTMFTAHASRHMAGGSDPLGKSSISGYMIQPRVIASHHIGVEAVQGDHLSPGAVTANSYRDTGVVEYDDGDVLDAPDGYENSKMDVMLCGFYIPPNVDDNTPQMPIHVKIVPGEAVVCRAKAVDDDLNRAQTDALGKVYVIRRCWP